MHEMPKPEAPGGFIQTLNGMGYMTSTLDRVSQAFVDESGCESKVLLEIGAAYGVASLEALQKGKSRIIANDLDSTHLKILKNRANPKHLDRLTLLPGSFPDELDIQPESIDCLLIVRVLHFFEGEQIVSALVKAKEWLKPGGRIFAVTETPYLRSLEKFIPVFEERVQKQEEWPGYFDFSIDGEFTRTDHLPPFMHFFTPDTLGKLFIETGFQIEFGEFLDRSDYPDDLRYTGKESTGIIARKI